MYRRPRNHTSLSSHGFVCLAILLYTHTSGCETLVPLRHPVLTGFEQPVSEGAFHRVTCNASFPGARTITYKWYKSNPTFAIEDGSYLEWPTISFEDRGRYMCRASTDAGAKDSDWADLYVYRKCDGLYTVDISTITPSLGGNFILQCSVKNPSRLDKLWKMQSSPLSNPVNVAVVKGHGCYHTDNARYRWLACAKGRYNLEVSNAQLSDSGVWRCHDINRTPEVSNPCADGSTPIKVTVIAPPKKPLTSGFTDPVVVNINHELSCQAWQEGAQFIEYSWYRGSNLISSWNTSVLYLAPVKKEDGGEYRCRASNSAGQTESDAKTLKVYYAPDAVALTSGRTIGDVGDVETFTCTSSGGSPSRQRLTFYRVPAGSGSVDQLKQERDSLTKTLLKQDNQAVFYCEASVPGYDSLKKRSSKLVYNVTFPNTKVSMSETPAGPIIEGGEKSFHCETDESNPASSIRWYQLIDNIYQEISIGITASMKNGNFGGKIRKSSLKLIADKTLNNRHFGCRSIYTKTDGSRLEYNSEQALSVMWSSTILEMVRKPDRPVNIGDKVTLRCETDSCYSQETIQWYRSRPPGNTRKAVSGGIRTSSRPGDYDGTVYESQLTFVAEKEDHQAKYECKTKNRTPFMKWTMIAVYFPPSVDLISNQNIIEEGSDVTLTCDTTGGNPTPSDGQYTWFFNNIEIICVKSEVFTIKRILYNMSGTYKCRVQNYESGSAMDTINIDVRYAPRWNSNFIENLKDAVKILHPAVLSLQVILNPGPPKVRLYKQNTSATVVFRTYTTEIIDMGGSAVNILLKIPNVTLDDYGTFLIEVANKVGQTNFTFTLLPSGSPDKPTDFSIVNKTAISVTVTFKPGFYGGSQQIFTIQFRSITSSRVYGRSDAKTVTGILDPGVGQMQIVRIPGLSSSTTYEFRLKATNDDGSKGYTESVTETTKEPPELNVQEFKILRDGNTVTVKWPPLGYSYTRLQIIYCDQGGKTDTSCPWKDIYDRNLNFLTFAVDKRKTYTYSLKIYDGSDEVFVSPFLKPVKNNTAHVGIIVGLYTAITLLVLVSIACVILAVLLWRNVEKGKANRTTPCESNKKIVGEKELTLYQNLTMASDNRGNVQESSLVDTIVGAYESIQAGSKRGPEVYNTRSTNQDNRPEQQDISAIEEHYEPLRFDRKDQSNIYEQLRPTTK